MTSSELIQNLDCEALLVALSKGSDLNADEINLIKDFVTYSLKAPKNKISLEELYSAATVLRRADKPELSYLLVLFLEFHDPILVSFVLETLVCLWGVYEDLQERLIQFSLGMPWDKDQDLRETALICIKHLLTSSEPALSDQAQNRLKSLAEEILKDHAASDVVQDLAKEILLLF